MSKSSLKSFLWVLCLVVISSGCGDQKKVPATATATATENPSAKPDPAGTNGSKVESPRTVADVQTEKQSGAEQRQQSDLIATDSDSAKLDRAEKSDKSGAREKPAPKKLAAAAAKKPAREQRPFAEAKLLPNDTIGIAVGHPMQFLASPFGKLLTEFGVGNVSFRGTDIVSRAMQLRFHEIERVTVVFQQSLIDQIAEQAGMQPPLMAPGAALEVAIPAEPADLAPGAAAAATEPADAISNKTDKIQLQNAMKMIGLAFHNYHDVNSAFPRANGDAAGDSTGLSWRVHLLPYLDQAPLYNQFNLEEPWDSEVNKALISKMPAIFRTPGVEDEGKTAFHVFTGEGTPFHGDHGPALQDFLDGTSNVILVVLAGVDKAEVWTKPGGLEVDLSAPKKAIGEIKDDKFLTLFADGHILDLSDADIDDQTLANLIQPADGNVVPTMVAGGDDFNTPMPFPTSIFTFANPPKQDEIVKELLGESTEETIEGQKIYFSPSAAVWFSNARTAVVGSADGVKKLIVEKRNENADASPLISELQLDADFTAAFDVESQALLLQQLAQFNQMFGMFGNIATVGVRVSATGQEGDSLIEINVNAVDANMAGGLAAIANLALNQAKMSANQIPEIPDASDDIVELQKISKQMISSAVIETVDEKIQFRVPIPSGFERLPELLKPAMTSAKAAAQQMQFTNNLKLMGLAFHNFHDTYGAFPGSGRVRADKPVGLSWRVYLLPFLDQNALYNQFKFDEPWDSDHNKALIDKMPDIFKSPGVDDVGKTTYHVFTGPRAPFADDETPGIAQFVDGTSNTILVVLAGAETAEVWTKPGGLDFDPDDPIKALGKLIGDQFLVLLADGSVQFKEKAILPANLRRMIQINDGEPLQ